MFVLDLSPSYWWPVKFSLPSETGAMSVATFDVQFKRLDAPVIAQMIERAKEGKMEDAQACREIVVGWKGVAAADGDEIPFSSSALDRLLRVPNVASAIARAYLQSLSQAAEKN